MKTNKLNVVLDTNVLLVSISPSSKYHWIFEKLILGEFNLYISNEILTEYEEIFSEKLNRIIAERTIQMLLTLPNVYKTDIYYKWDLITADNDDNKFVDCYISGNVDFLVTHDKHFDILKNIEFPIIETLKIDEFHMLLLKNNL